MISFKACGLVLFSQGRPEKEAGLSVLHVEVFRLGQLAPRGLGPGSTERPGDRDPSTRTVRHGWCALLWTRRLEQDFAVVRWQTDDREIRDVETRRLPVRVSRIQNSPWSGAMSVTGPRWTRLFL